MHGKKKQDFSPIACTSIGKTWQSTQKFNVFCFLGQWEGRLDSEGYSPSYNNISIFIRSAESLPKNSYFDPLPFLGHKTGSVARQTEAIPQGADLWSHRRAVYGLLDIAGFVVQWQLWDFFVSYAKITWLTPSTTQLKWRRRGRECPVSVSTTCRQHYSLLLWKCVICHVFQDGFNSLVSALFLLIAGLFAAAKKIIIEHIVGGVSKRVYNNSNVTISLTVSFVWSFDWIIE